MSSDKITAAVIDALKEGMAEAGEHRLYRSGKLSGLFSGRTGTQADAAAQALRDGLIEVVRTETKGKTAVDWVRLTPKGVDFLAQHESPVRAMDELRAALEMTKEGIPAWLAQIRRTMQELGERLAQEVHGVARRLEALCDRAAEALKRAEQAAPKLPAGSADAFPWAQDAVGYLERRREGGAQAPCPLPELFAALRPRHESLSLCDYHAGLRRLQDRGVLNLLPFEGPGELPEPEYALVDGSGVFYYVGR